MEAALDEELSLLARHPNVPRRLWTVDEYHRMGEAGLLANEDRVELVEGELVQMAPIGSEHAGCVGGLTRLLVMAVGERAIVFVQNPVRLDERSEPQPDFAVLKPRADEYRSALPTAQDVLLIVEVSDSSLAYDRGLKLELYARHAIQEVWVVNLAAQDVEVFRGPHGGDYTFPARFGRSSTLDIAALPGVSIPADRVFGTASGQKKADR